MCDQHNKMNTIYNYCNVKPMKGNDMSRKKDNEMLAMDIYRWCNDKGLWGDCAVYFNGKMLSSNSRWGEREGRKIDEHLYEYDNMNPFDYVKYANTDTVTMTFEGALYDVLNSYCPGWDTLEDEFISLFEKYDYYYEMGYSWSLSAYEN